MSYDPTEEDESVECPECGMDYEPGYELVEGTVYVCGHCGTELVVRKPGWNELTKYWGEFWEEIKDGEGEDNAPRVTLGRKQENDDFSSSFMNLFRAGMEAAAKGSMVW